MYGSDPDAWRVWLSGGLSGGADLPRCARVPDLRGNVGCAEVDIAADAVTSSSSVLQPQHVWTLAREPEALRTKPMVTTVVLQLLQRGCKANVHLARIA